MILDLQESTRFTEGHIKRGMVYIKTGVGLSRWKDIVSKISESRDEAELKQRFKMESFDKNGRREQEKAAEPLWGGSLLFTTKFPEIPDTHLIDIGRMKGWVDLGATQFFLNTVPLDWKSSALNAYFEKEGTLNLKFLT